MKRISMLDLRLEYEYMKADIDAAIEGVLGHQRWIQGPEVKELEAGLAAYLGVKHCIGVSSGTDALVLSLRALAIREKGEEFFDKSDEIITTPFTFTATGDAILRAGATPVFVDIDPLTCNLDAGAVEDYLKSSGGNVVGILPVHLYGRSCEMEAIGALAAEHGVFVLEDVAQAFGGTYNDAKLGSLGTLGAFSFFPSKNLGGFGDGGMISTSDDELAELARMLLRHGGKDKYNVDHIGYNSRLDTIQAAVLLARLKHIDEFNSKRVKIAEAYNAGLDCPGLALPPHVSGHVYHQYTLRVKDEKRDALQGHLREANIDSMVYYPVPLHKMKVFGGGRARVHGGLEEAEGASLDVLSLPMEPLQDREDTNRIIECVLDFMG